jgi:predicted DNA binding CopG/RHH family protein
MNNIAKMQMEREGYKINSEAEVDIYARLGDRLFFKMKQAMFTAAYVECQYMLYETNSPRAQAVFDRNWKICLERLPDIMDREDCEETLETFIQNFQEDKVRQRFAANILKDPKGYLTEGETKKDDGVQNT